MSVISESRAIRNMSIMRPCACKAKTTYKGQPVHATNSTKMCVCVCVCVCELVKKSDQLQGASRALTNAIEQAVLIAFKQP